MIFAVGLDVIVIDELGYLNLKPEQSNIFFKLMEERYRRGRDTVEVRGVATYSRFRRFQVSTSEEIAR